MQDDPESLAALLARVRSGDEAALLHLLQQYENRLRTAVRVMIGPGLRAQMDSLDLVQSVHRVLLPGFREGKYDISSVDKLIALARTVVRHKVIRKWRRMEREKELLAQNQVNPQGTAPNSDPAAAALTSDLARYILALLPEPDRKLLEMRLQGFSTVEIGEKMQCDPHILRARLTRLRQKLRQSGFAEWV